MPDLVGVVLVEVAVLLFIPVLAVVAMLLLRLCSEVLPLSRSSDRLLEKLWLGGADLLVPDRAGGEGRTAAAGGTTGPGWCLNVTVRPA